MSDAASSALPDFNRLWDFAHPDETERKFRELLPAAEASGDQTYWLSLGTQIARAMGLQGKFDEAHMLLDEIREKLSDDVPVAKVRYLLERGRAYNSQRARALAVEHFADALKVGESNGLWNFAIDAVHMLAIAEPDRNEQVRWGETGLRMVSEHPEHARWLPALYNNLGETFRALKQYDKALLCFEKLAEIDREAGRPVDMYTTKDIAKMNRLTGRHEIALGLIEPIAKELAAKGEPDGYISAEYGECLLAAGHAVEANPHFAHAYEVLSQDPYMLNHEPDELAQLKALARGM